LLQPLRHQLDRIPLVIRELQVSQIFWAITWGITCTVYRKSPYRHPYRQCAERKPDGDGAVTVWRVPYTRILRWRRAALLSTTPKSLSRSDQPFLLYRKLQYGGWQNVDIQSIQTQAEPADLARYPCLWRILDISKSQPCYIVLRSLVVTCSDL